MYRLRFQNERKDITPYMLFYICMRLKNNFLYNLDICIVLNFEMKGININLWSNT